MVVNGYCSDPCPVLSGVPQGTVLAPLLFLLFINDIAQNINCTIRLYADDILIYTTIYSLSDCQCLQGDLHTLQNWAKIWQMKFNPSKCSHLIISNKHHILHYNYHLCDQLIQRVLQAKYLGVTFDQHLKWKHHIASICNKANAAKSFLKRNVNYCPTNIKANCYKSFVRPILEYASPVWSPHLQCDIQ